MGEAVRARDAASAPEPPRPPQHRRTARSVAGSGRSSPRERSPRAVGRRARPAPSRRNAHRPRIPRDLHRDLWRRGARSRRAAAALDALPSWGNTAMPVLADIDSAGSSTGNACRRVACTRRASTRRLLLARIGEDDGELIAPDRRNGIGRADSRFQPRGDHGEDRVAGTMSPRVVHSSEVVEIEQEQREGSASRTMSDGGFQRLAETPPVGQPREVIGSSISTSLRHAPERAKACGGSHGGYHRTGRCERDGRPGHRYLCRVDEQSQACRRRDDRHGQSGEPIPATGLRGLVREAGRPGDHRPGSDGECRQ